MARISDVIEGLQIIQKYVEPDEHLGGAEHDIIYAVPGDTSISDEDVARLIGLGWHNDSECGWSHFC